MTNIAITILLSN